MTKNALIDVTEQKRLNEAREAGIPWKKWGPYLSERQWGTVREDYSDDGNAWDYFSHDQSRSRAYRWGEDGLGGISDDKQRLCFALALWNERDPILKERAVRPDQQRGQPRRGREGVLLLRRQHADALVHEVPLQVPAAGIPVPRPRGDQPRALARGDGIRAARHRGVRRGPVLRRLRRVREGGPRGPPRPDHRPQSRARSGAPPRAADAVVPEHVVVGRRRPEAVTARRRAPGVIHASHDELGDYWLCCDGEPELLFTENETNAQRLWGQPNASPYVKDAFHAYVVGGDAGAVNPARTGTKAAAHYALDVPAGGSRTVRLRLVGRRRRRRPSTASRRRFSSGSTRRTSSTSGSRRHRSARTSGGCTGRRWPACCGASSSTTSTWSGG